MRMWKKSIPMMLVMGMALAWYGDVPQAQVCTPTGPQPELQYLRRLSLDLRGHLPTVAEMQSVITTGKVATETIAKMISSDAMLEQIEDYHKDLLWANISNIRLSNVAWSLSGNGTTVPHYISSQGRKGAYRGQNVACLNKPAEYNSDGSFKTTPGTYKAPNGNDYPVNQEGYVMVRPYWDPSKEVKVCGFDASTALSHTDPKTNRSYDCSKSAYSSASGSCGCGPNLRWCLPNMVEVEILNSLIAQTQRFVVDIVKNRKPYTEIITGKTLELNGPISHYLRYQTAAAGGLTYATPIQNHEIPTIGFEKKDTWVKVDRGNLHAGVLTTPMFLLKFSSDRGRATRFYSSFLCTHFQAPPGGLPPAQDSCHDEPNLMKRCGCKYCHQTVEPAAAYWGRWAEAGIAVLNPDEYPPVSDFCKKMQNRNNAMCRRFYFYPNDDKEMDYLGHFIPYVFATPTIKQNIEAGPIALAQQSIDDGTFASCTTRKMWTWFVGADSHPQQESQILQLAANFKSNRYDLLKLIQAIVSTPEYRRGRLLHQ